MTVSTLIGRYEVIRELGRGAMGTVYLARDTALGRLVALKAFRTTHDDADPEDSGIRRRRTLREAQRAGTLSHPNVITIYDLLETSPDGDSFHIVMEYVEGQGLDARMRAHGAMKLAEVAPLVTQIAAALDHLHARGIVHRDVKPGNVLVADDGRVKITDFGIARAEDPASTLDTDVYGTPYYMAPEQIQGRPVDARTDVFSLGVVLYEMLTGARPFPGKTVAEVAHRIVYGPPAEPEVNGQPLPAALRDVLMQALAKEPADRFPTAGALAAAVQDLAEASGDLDLSVTKAFPRSRWLASGPVAPAPLPRTRLVVAAAVAVAVMLLAGGFLYLRSLDDGEPATVDAELQARRIGYVKLMTEGKQLFAAGDFQDAALLFQTAEGLAIDPAGARRLREEAQRRAEEQGAQLQLLDARQALASGHYADVVGTARRMMETRAGREQAASVLAEVQEALAKGETAPSPRARSEPRRVRNQPTELAPLAIPAPTAIVNFGVLRIELHSESPEGIFTAWVDGREVARETFAFYERTGWFRKRPVTGSRHVEMTLWPGSHTVRLLVVRPGEGGQVATVEVPIEAGGLRTLMARLPGTGAMSHELR
jgi:serine/threonine-protein kinase